jgi:hypothetical protein
MGLLWVSCGGDRHVVTADIVPNEFSNGNYAALCVNGAFVPAQWVPFYEEVLGSDAPDTVRVRPQDGSPSVAGIGDRIEVVIERRRDSGRGGGPFAVAQVVEVRDVVVGGAETTECNSEIISDNDDEWWARLP